MANELQFVKFARRGNPYLGAIINEVVDSPWWDLPFVTEGWDAATTSTVTAPGGFCSSWAPVKGTHAFAQATGAAQPGYLNGVFTFDGLAQFMATGAFTLNQPSVFLLAIKQLTWTSSDEILDGNSANTAVVQQFGGSPKLNIYAGTDLTQATGNLAIGARGIVVVTFNGGSSSIQVNLNAATSGNAGAANAGGMTLGAGAGGTAFGNFECYGIGRCVATLSAGETAQAVNSMGAAYGVPL